MRRKLLPNNNNRQSIEAVVEEEELKDKDQEMEMTRKGPEMPTPVAAVKPQVSVAAEVDVVRERHPSLPKKTDPLIKQVPILLHQLQHPHQLAQRSFLAGSSHLVQIILHQLLLRSSQERSLFQLQAPHRHLLQEILHWERHLLQP